MEVGLHVILACDPALRCCCRRTVLLASSTAYVYISDLCIVINKKYPTILIWAGNR